MALIRAPTKFDSVEAAPAIVGDACNASALSGQRCADNFLFADNTMAPTASHDPSNQQGLMGDVDLLETNRQSSSVGIHNRRCLLWQRERQLLGIGFNGLSGLSDLGGNLRSFAFLADAKLTESSWLESRRLQEVPDMIG